MKSAKNIFKLTAMTAAILASQAVMAQSTTDMSAPEPMITTESNLDAWTNSAAYIGAALRRRPDATFDASAPSASVAHRGNRVPSDSYARRQSGRHVLEDDGSWAGLRLQVLTS